MTFLNIHQLERQGAGIQSKLENINSSLRERDNVKDDAIAHLSDQLLALFTRLQELERKQHTAVLTQQYIYMHFTLGVLSDVDLVRVECKTNLTQLFHLDNTNKLME